MDNEMNEKEIEEQLEEETAEASDEETAEEAVGETSDEQNAESEDITAKLEKELAEQKEKYLRLMAEYDNYRKRTAKQQLETRDAAIGDTIMNVIAVYDNFERAMNSDSFDQKGIEMIFTQFTQALDKLNVKIIDPTGEPFDPATANAVSQIEDPDLGENVVAQVFEKGVMIGDKVIRYPVVVVANP